MTIPDSKITYFYLLEMTIPDSKIKLYILYSVSF